MALEIIALSSELAALREAQRWIPVGDVLPDTADWVWVFDRWTNGTYTAKWLDSKWHNLDWRDGDLDITHWRPLPEPPTEAQSESNEQEEE